METRIEEKRFKRGFTLIELIVVMSIIGMLTLFAAPRFIDKTKEAQFTQIQNDIRVLESKIGETLAVDADTVEGWDTVAAADLQEPLADSRLIDLNGPVAVLQSDSYKAVPADYFNSKLKGDFYTTLEGRVLYQHTNGIPSDAAPEEQKPLTFEEWAEKVKAKGYVLAADTDFTKVANTSAPNKTHYWRYTGSGEYVILPKTINGEVLSDYYKMFDGSSSKTIKGVASYNELVTYMGYMFYGNYSLSLDVSELNTSNVTTMIHMFKNSDATSLDLRSFDTSNVTDMSYMFGNSAAMTLDLSSFDTSNVTITTDMFYTSKATTGYARTTKDATKFNVSSYKPTALNFAIKAEAQPVDYVLATDADFVGEMNGTFRYNGANHYVIMPHTIKGIAVTSYKNMFEYSDVRGVVSTNKNITDMSYMFYGGYAPSLDVSELDTSNVTNMSFMFRNNDSSSLDLRSFDTSKVTTMSYMFQNDDATSLDLRSFDTSTVTDMSYMFYNSDATTLDLSSFDTSSVTETSNMFYTSKATIGYARTTKDATKLNASSYKPSALNFAIKAEAQPVNYALAKDADFVGETNGTFRYTGANHYVIMPNTIKGVSVTSYKNMFEYSDVRGVISTNKNITDMSYMFYSGYAASLDVSELDTSNVTSMSHMFRNNDATSLDLSSFDTSKVMDMSYMFKYSSATSLNLSSFETSNVTDMGSMFSNGEATILDLSSFDTSSVTGTSDMFFTSKATTGYARTTADATKFNNSKYKSAALTFIIK